MADSSEHDETPRETVVQPPQKGPRSLKSWVILALKIGVSTFGLYKVWQAVIAKDGFDEIAGHLGRLHWGWFAAAVAMQLFAIGCAVVRWRVMLGGQGVRSTWSFLFPSFMIGRFWGAFTPGGLGLDGWKLFDVGYHTKKYARAIAVTAVEKVLGQLAFGIVVMLSSAWGFAFIGTEGVILVNVFFLVLVGAGMTLLARPALFRLMGRMLPRQVQPRLQTLIDAVCAYHGKGMLLAQAVALGVGVHAFNNLIYVCAARALGIDLSMQLVFFASSMQIMATLVPISVNGVGLREAAAVALYATVGLSEAQAVLIPTVGFGAEMLVSLTGVLFLFARRIGGEVRGLSVEDAEREDKFYAELPAIPEAEWPRRLRGLTVGASAGLVAGMIVGVAEGAVVVADGGGRVGFGVMAYGAVAYGVFCALGGAAFGLASAWVGRLMQREAVPEPQAFGRLAALMVAAIGFGLAAFRIRRDVFHEEIGWKSKEMLLVAAGCALAAAAVYFGLSFALRALSSRRAGAFLLRAWGSPALVAVVVALVVGVATALPPAQASDASRGAAPDSAPNVLVIVVDTLRADHLPAYGYEGGRTPNLDRFAEDAVRYEQAFANASWTRPSFASILTGRYASSHGVMGKPDSLPDDAVTLPEALREGGYETAGFVTNFNVGPYFNFQQGFDEYAFLEPEFVLGADDSAAKLLLVQTMRQVIERVRAARGAVEPGTAYQDAETVNRHLVSWLERDERERPFFLFVGYMDPHDPYFPAPLRRHGLRARRAPAARPERGAAPARALRRRDHLLGRALRPPHGRAAPPRPLRRHDDRRDLGPRRGVRRARRLLARHHALRRAAPRAALREVPARRARRHPRGALGAERRHHAERARRGRPLRRPGRAGPRLRAERGGRLRGGEPRGQRPDQRARAARVGRLQDHHGQRGQPARPRAGRALRGRRRPGRAGQRGRRARGRAARRHRDAGGGAAPRRGGPPRERLGRHGRGHAPPALRARLHRGRRVLPRGAAPAGAVPRHLSVLLAPRPRAVARSAR
ncbi:MAG: sulfatase-like hydrolase/transferase [Sandaracinaceae bacterium]|nr:sulfatase-like hydrolase/transferase [Sandaracinaceae bacterium]